MRHNYFYYDEAEKYTFITAPKTNDSSGISQHRIIKMISDVLVKLFLL